MRIYNSREKQESRDEELSKDSCYYGVPGGAPVPMSGMVRGL